MRTADYARSGIWAEIGADLHQNPATVGAVVGWVRCEPGWSWERRLDEYDLWAVVGGRGAATVNGLRHRLRAGSTLLLRPGDRVSAVQHPIDRLTVGFAHYRRAGAAALLPPRVVELRDPHLVHDPLRALIRRVERPDPAAPVQAAALLHTALLEVHVQAAQHAQHLPASVDPRIRSAIERLRSQPASRPGLADIARSVGLSTAHFSRLFRQQTGTSFRAYCVHARMDRARGLLADTSLSVTQVAQLLGYSDYRLFARQFAGRHGRSPSAWRATTA